MSLNEARENYKKFGAKAEISLRRVRPPLPEEIVATDKEKNDDKSQ